MQSLEFFLADFPTKLTREEMQVHFEQAVIRYLQQAALLTCPRLYQTLLYHWNQDTILAIKQVKKHAGIKNPNDYFEKLYTRVLVDLLRLSFDPIKTKYQHEPINDDSTAEIEWCVIEKMIAFLQIRGKQRLAKQAKALSLLWHPDKEDLYSDTMKWLDTRLKPGHCFKLIAICVTRVENPNLGPSTNKNHSRGESANKLEDNLLNAKTYSERLFCRAILQWLKDVEQNCSTANELFPARGAIINRLSLLFTTSAGAFFFSDEILMLGGLYGFLALTKLATYASSSPEARKLEQYCDSMKTNLFYGSLGSFFMMSSAFMRFETTSMNSVLNAYQLVSDKASTTSTKKTAECNFQSPSIKYITDHLRRYVDRQKLQWLSPYRYGVHKAIIMGRMLKQMESIDHSDAASDEKLNQVEMLLIAAGNNKQLTESGTEAARAVTFALDELSRVRTLLINRNEEEFYSLTHHIVSELDDYIDEQSKQWLADWRYGSNKAKKISDAISNLNAIRSDRKLSMDVKLDKIRKVLLGLANDPVIKQSGHQAQDKVKHTLQMLMAIMPATPNVPTKNNLLMIGYQ